MLYLILAILSSAAVSVIMRLSEKYVENNISMLAVNYVMCLLMATIYTGVNQIYIEGMSNTFFLGIINGILYLAGFILLQKNIKKNGVILSSLFMKLGVLIPMIISIFVFKEVPQILQVIGFIIAVIAIIYMNYDKANKRYFNFSLLILLFESGITDSMSKIYEELGNPLLSEQFLFYTFLFALILCFCLVIFKKQKFTINEIKYGLMIGIPNYFSSRFLLLSLTEVPAVIVYPTFSVGTIIIVTLIGIFLFKEKIFKHQKISLIAILISLILLNL